MESIEPKERIMKKNVNNNVDVQFIPVATTKYFPLDYYRNYHEFINIISVCMFMKNIFNWLYWKNEIK